MAKSSSRNRRTSAEGECRKSITLKLIRHAESRNNQLYRSAHVKYNYSTPEFDFKGWNEYVNNNRKADPSISDRGIQQANMLKDYLISNLTNQASFPVRIVVSPMRRTLETIIPTIHSILNDVEDDTVVGEKCKIVVNGFYHESEGCHLKDVAEGGMNRREITDLIFPPNSKESSFLKDKVSLSFIGFPSDNEDDGWYVHKSGPETRAESEIRAAKFYTWICHHLDYELNHSSSEQESDDNCVEGNNNDIFDASVTREGEEHENEYDKMSARRRKRRQVLLVGHGDFMSLVLKRVVSGFGYSIEKENTPHRAAMIHFNTGITELEYFGRGRFLVMSTNHTPHLDNHPDGFSLKSGGGLKDGWSYLMPRDDHISPLEIYASFPNELDDHIREQTDALKSLYINHRQKSLEKRRSISLSDDSFLQIEDETEDGEENETLSVPLLHQRRLSSSIMTSFNENDSLDSKSSPVQHNNVNGDVVTFVMKRGSQVTGHVTFNEQSRSMHDFLIIPSEKYTNAAEMLLSTVINYAKRGVNEDNVDSVQSNEILIESSCAESQSKFDKLGLVRYTPDCKSKL